MLETATIRTRDLTTVLSLLKDALEEHCSLAWLRQWCLDGKFSAEELGRALGRLETRVDVDVQIEIGRIGERQRVLHARRGHLAAELMTRLQGSYPCGICLRPIAEGTTIWDPVSQMYLHQECREKGTP
jgi:hypothetical protein